MKLYHTCLSDENMAYRAAIRGAFAADVILFKSTTPESASKSSSKLQDQDQDSKWEK